MSQFLFNTDPFVILLANARPHAAKLTLFSKVDNAPALQGVIAAAPLRLTSDPEFDHYSSLMKVINDVATPLLLLEMRIFQIGGVKDYFPLLKWIDDFWVDPDTYIYPDEIHQKYCRYTFSRILRSGTEIEFVDPVPGMSQYRLLLRLVKI